MGDKDETWRQKIRFQQSPLLLFGALCRDGLQKDCPLVASLTSICPAVNVSINDVFNC